MAGGRIPAAPRGDQGTVEANDKAIMGSECGPSGPWRSGAAPPVSHRLSAAMVISAISRAIAAPSLMAMPASASDKAGESLMPSPHHQNGMAFPAELGHKFCLV